MLFSGEEGLKPTEALSGGEAARLIFCKLMLQKPNFLVLDEPTNHLDLEAINALNMRCRSYEGTVLLVTHDQDLIDEVATRIWHFDPGASRTSRGRIRNIFRRAQCSRRDNATPRAGSRYFFTGFAEVSQASIGPSPRALTPASILDLSPTRMRNVLSGWTYFVAASAAWAEVTDSSWVGSFSK